MRASKATSRRIREFRQLERKALLGVIAGAAFICIVAILAVYFGLNVHKP